jgi:hypothetical protein
VKRYVGAIFSLALLATNSGRAAGDQGYVTFSDPLEHAFTLDVPAGWAARGGMFRLGYSDYRPMVDLQSPDGRTDIRLGDVAVPSYAVPTALHSEGETDDLGAQAQLVFARYRTGQQYVTLYALTRFKTLCGRLTPERNEWKPPVQAKGSDGSITYRCDGKAGQRTAYAYAKTLQEGPALWQVVSIGSFIAPPERVPAVEAAIGHAVATFKLEPAWIAHQKQMDAAGLQYQIARQRQRMADLGRQVAAFQSRMQGMQEQVNAFERGQQARQTQFEGFDNAINGVTPTVDPLSGETRDVWTGPNNGYWVNGTGTIVNSNLSPGAGFRQLHPL